MEKENNNKATLELKILNSLAEIRIHSDYSLIEVGNNLNEYSFFRAIEKANRSGYKDLVDKYLLFYNRLVDKDINSETEIIFYNRKGKGGKN